MHCGRNKLLVLVSFLSASAGGASIDEPCSDGYCTLALGESELIADSGEDFFSLSHGSSITDVLDRSLLEDEDTIDDIRVALLEGKIVEIRGAFIPSFAELAFEQLDRDDMNWTLSDEGFSSDDLRRKLYIPGHRSRKLRGENASYSQELHQILQMFDENKTKEFLTKLSGRNCNGPTPRLSPSWYQEGDSSAPHNDFSNFRSLSFLWNLSKDWEPSWGGAFYWHAAKTVEEGYHYPKFNTLILFLPTPSSIHSVTTVLNASTGKSKRLALGGWYLKAAEERPFIETPIEEMFINKEDHNRLTASEASFIASFDLDEVAEKYPERYEKLQQLQESVANEYLFPIHENTVIYVSEDEDEGVE